MGWLSHNEHIGMMVSWYDEKFVDNIIFLWYACLTEEVRGEKCFSGFPTFYLSR